MDTNMRWLPAPYEPPGATQPEPAAPPTSRPGSPIRRRVSAFGAALVALLAKFKAVLLVLPKLKLLASTGTILVSLAAYALLWGWPFAAGFIALLFVHE